MLNSPSRINKATRMATARFPVARFGFDIRTRGGVLIENLSIPGASIEEAERKLRQIYRGCSVIARSMPE
jgi:hypothetical protein